jgi:hypothetical protein
MLDEILHMKPDFGVKVKDMRQLTKFVSEDMQASDVHEVRVDTPVRHRLLRTSVETCILLSEASACLMIGNVTKSRRAHQFQEIFL